MQAVNETVRAFGSELSKWIPLLGGGASKKEAEKIVVREVQAVMPGAAQLFVKIAGLSGALAVTLGAYGTHVFKPGHDPELAHVFETGNRYHLLHSIALLAVPLTHRPQIVGTFMLTGMLLFSGSCYVHALTGNKAIRQLTPYGGMLLITAWIAVMM